MPSPRAGTEGCPGPGAAPSTFLIKPHEAPLGPFLELPMSLWMALTFRNDTCTLISVSPAEVTDPTACGMDGGTESY